MQQFTNVNNNPLTSVYKCKLTSINSKYLVLSNIVYNFAAYSRDKPTRSKTETQ
jgi:hypothetical protein